MTFRKMWDEKSPPTDKCLTLTCDMCNAFGILHVNGSDIQADGTGNCACANDDTDTLEEVEVMPSADSMTSTTMVLCICCTDLMDQAERLA